MNASDIVKAKRSQTLYKTYYQPTVFQSSVFSTITPVSSFINYISSGVPITSTSYVSCTTTAYSYQCGPTFLTYANRYAVKDGAYSCGGRAPSNLQWNRATSTVMYSYSTLYSSLNNPSTLVPSTVRVNSTIIQTGQMPLICPLIQLQQGTNFANSSPPCAPTNGACCVQCNA